MPWIARHQFFDITHDHLHGPSGTLRKQVSQGHIHGRGLPAEISANPTWVYQDPIFRYPESTRQLSPQGVGDLVVRPDLDTSSVIHVHHTSVRLHIALVHPSGGKGVF